MTQTAPWLSFHAPWTERAKSGMVLLARIRRFLDAVAVDTAPSSIDMTIVERLVPPLPAIVDEATAAFGAPLRPPALEPGKPGGLARWQWERRVAHDVAIPADEVAAFIEFYRSREHLPPVEGHHGKRAVGLVINHWFDVKRPGTTTALFPGSSLQSSVMVWLDSRHANLSIRYDAPELTPELRAAHADIVAALGPKTPRHAFQRIIPARTPGGRERREPIT